MHVVRRSPVVGGRPIDCLSHHREITDEIHPAKKRYPLTRQERASHSERARCQAHHTKMIHFTGQDFLTLKLLAYLSLSRCSSVMVMIIQSEEFGSSSKRQHINTKLMDKADVFIPTGQRIQREEDKNICEHHNGAPLLVCVHEMSGFSCHSLKVPAI